VGAKRKEGSSAFLVSFAVNTSQVESVVISQLTASYCNGSQTLGCVSALSSVQPRARNTHAPHTQTFFLLSRSTCSHSTYSHLFTLIHTRLFMSHRRVAMSSRREKYIYYNPVCQDAAFIATLTSTFSKKAPPGSSLNTSSSFALQLHPSSPCLTHQLGEVARHSLLISNLPLGNAFIPRRTLTQCDACLQYKGSAFYAGITLTDFNNASGRNPTNISHLSYLSCLQLCNATS